MGNGDQDVQITTKGDLISILSSSSHAFLQPSSQLHATSVAHAKRYLDPLARATTEAQHARLRLARKKRKRRERDPYDPQEVLKLRELYIDGFHINQIWEQAKRVLNTATQEAERSLDEVLGRGIHSVAGKQTSREGKPQSLEANGVSHTEVSGEDLEGEDGDKVYSDIAMDSIDESRESSHEFMPVEGGEKESWAEGDRSDEEMDLELSENGFGASEDEDDEPSETFVPDKHGLNDGFFSIDDFNRQSNFLENQDVKGADDEVTSDEEEIDWAADPSSTTMAAGKNRIGDRDTQSSEEEDAGPTFGNVDLNGRDSPGSDEHSDEDVALDDIQGINNTNDIKYADFFAPPARKTTKSSRGGALSKTQPPPRDEQSEDDVQRTISAVKRDIFDDELTASEAEDNAVSVEKSIRSSHEKRQAALTSEIRRLEAAALAKRDWRLSGEARASDRPLNSLLEEDVDFERVGKPVPVITQEVSEDIESMIKRRILAREFDEVVRRRPENLATQQQKQQRRGLFDLSSSKADQSLAELYEADHLRRTDPASHPTAADQKLQAEHAIIVALWKDISSQLDALTSLHFRPKPPTAEVTVVSDVPAIQMEDARPAGVEGIAGAPGAASSMLAPQEIYRAGAGDDEINQKAKGHKTEVRTRSGLPVGKEEMTREEKKRRRRREKERLRKAGGDVTGDSKLTNGAGKASAGSNKRQKERDEREGVVKDLKKSGVKVIGRKGDLRDVDGKAVRDRSDGRSVAGVYKL